VNAPQYYIICRLPLLLCTVLSILYVCVDVFSGLKTKINVSSLLHDNKNKKPLTLSAATETERIVTTFFTLIPGGCNWFVRHGR